MAYDQHAVYGEAQEPFVTVESSEHSSATSGRNLGDDDDVIVLSPTEETNRPLAANTSWNVASTGVSMALDHLYSSSSATALSRPDLPQMPLFTFPRAEPPAPRGADSSSQGSTRQHRFSDLTPLFTRVRDFLSVVDNNQDTAHSGWESPLPGPSLASLLSPPRPTTPPRSSTYATSELEPFSFLYSHNRSNNPTTSDRKSNQNSLRKPATVTREGILDSSTSESEIEIVGYEKPFEDRTPIALSSESSDVEMIEIEALERVTKKKKRKKSRWDDPNASNYRDLQDIFQTRPQAHSSQSGGKPSRSPSSDTGRSRSRRKEGHCESSSDAEHYRKGSMSPRSKKRTPARSPRRQHKSESHSPVNKDKSLDGTSPLSRKKKKYYRSRSDSRRYSESSHTTDGNLSQSPRKQPGQRLHDSEKRSRSPKKTQSSKDNRRRSLDRDKVEKNDHGLKPPREKLDKAWTKHSETSSDNGKFRDRHSSERKTSSKARSSYSILDVEKYRAKQKKRQHFRERRYTISRSRSRSRTRSHCRRSNGYNSTMSSEYKHKKYRRRSRQDSESPEERSHRSVCRSRSNSRSTSREPRLHRVRAEWSESRSRSESQECHILSIEKPPRKSRRSQSKSPVYRSKRSRSRSSDCQIFISRSRRRRRASSESSVEFIVAKPARRHGKHRKHKKHKRHRYYVIEDSDSNHSGHGIEILDIFPAKRHKKKSSKDKYNKHDDKKYKKHHSGHKKSSKKYSSRVDREGSHGEGSHVSCSAGESRNRSGSVECVGVNTDNVPPPVGAEVAIGAPKSPSTDLPLLNQCEATLPISEAKNTMQSYTSELDRSCEVSSTNCSEVLALVAPHKSQPLDQLVVDGEVIAYPMHGEDLHESKSSQAQSSDHTTEIEEPKLVPIEDNTTASGTSTWHKFGRAHYIL